MSIKKLILSMVGFALAPNIMAGNSAPLSVYKHPLSVTASLGFSKFQNMVGDDGEAILGRFSIGKELFLIHSVAIGIEVGVQNGKDMRLDVSSLPPLTYLELGGLPFNSSVKTMADILITAQSAPLGNFPICAQIKTGPIYRQWKFQNRSSINNLAKLDAEIQFGFSYHATDSIHLNLMYQGVFGEEPNLQVNTLTWAEHVSNIPLQHGLLLGTTVTFN